MRLRLLDRARWEAIARELGDLCDEIAEDQYPDTPLEEIPAPAPGEWPDDAPAVHIWRDLNRASALATLHAGFPHLTMSQLRQTVTASGRGWA